MSLFCGSRCQDRKDKKLELKYEKKMAKIEASVDKVEVKQETKQVAYANGIDPSAARWEAINGIVGSVAGAATAIAAPGSSVLSATKGTSSVFGATGGNSSNSQGGLLGTTSGSSSWLWLVLAAIAVMIFKRN